MLAHCLSAGVPFGQRPEYNMMMPTTPDYIKQLYDVAHEFTAKVRADLKKIGEWDFRSGKLHKQPLH